MSLRALSVGLGWFSIGLGAAELASGGGLSRALGLGQRPGLVRAYGLREIGVGVALLEQPEKARWLWARVAGDALDIATLAPALREDNPRRPNAVIALAAVLGVTVLDLAGAIGLQRREMTGSS